MPKFNFGTLMGCDDKLTSEVGSNLSQDEDEELSSHKPPKTIKKNRKPSLIRSYESMNKEVKLLGRTIPFDDVRDLARESLEHNRNLIKGIKYYLNAWESRYNKYKEEKPNNFLIDEFESMQKTLGMLKKNEKIYEVLKNAKGK